MVRVLREVRNMTTTCIKCGKDLSDGGAYFDSSLRKRKEELIQKKRSNNDKVYAWCSKCYIEEIQLRENACLIGKFLVYYSNYQDIQSYTLNEILTRAFVLPSKVECEEEMINIIERLIRKEGLEITVQDITQELSKADLLGRRKTI